MNRLTQFSGDLRVAARTLARQPGFALAAILTLALGIGGATAMFSVVDSALLRPLPFPGPERIVQIHNVSTATNEFEMPIDAADYYDFRDRMQSFEAIALVRFRELMTLMTGGEPQSVQVHSATGSLFRVLGVTPALGRVFEPGEETPGRDQSVILSHGLWTARFGGRADVIGTKVSVGGFPRTVIGVLPRDFEFPDRPADAWVPLAPAGAEVQRRTQHRYRMFARLKPEVSREQAAGEMTLVNSRISAENPKTNTYLVRLAGLAEQRVEQSKAGLWILMAGAMLVLLTGCANVANLMLARATARHKEMAIRAALGATRGRLAGQLLTESFLLSACAGLAGVVAAFWLVAAAKGVLPADLPGRTAVELNARAVLFAVAASLLTGVLFGLRPAFDGSRSDAAGSLRERSSSGGRATLRLRSVLVVGEVALAVTLLVGGGLLIRSFLRVLENDPGLRPARVLTGLLDLPRAKYPTAETVTAFYAELVRRLAASPGVESAGIVNKLPLNGSIGSGPMSVEGQPTSNEQIPVVDWRSASQEYFQTMGIPLMRGLGVQESDTPSSPHVVVVDDVLAAQFWPNQDPIGRRVKMGLYDDPRFLWMTVVGVVRHVRHSGLDIESRGQAYRPYAQYPVHGLYAQSYAAVVRTTGPAAGFASTLRRLVQSIDPEMTASEVRTMDDVVDQSLAPRRFQATLAAGFALVALALAAVGLSAVIAYATTLRSHEIAIRIALGASSGNVLGLVAGDTAKLAAFGLAAGLGASAALGRLLASLLFGISRFDWITFLGAAVIVALVAVVAGLAPARRALRTDPVAALRAER